MAETLGAKLSHANDPAERIIVALDSSDAGQAQRIVDELRGRVGAFKIGLQLFTVAGPQLVRKFVDSGVKIFLDLKFHDIPNTAANASIEAARLGVWMFNVHAIGGAEMMRYSRSAMLEFCSREGIDVPKMIAVTILTSSNNDTLADIGIVGDTGENVMRLAALAASCGLDGVVASPIEAEAIRAGEGTSDLLIVTPGIRPAGSRYQDQKRVTTPAAALCSGADHIVIGRPITAASDRQKAVADIIREIGEAQDSDLRA